MRRFRWATALTLATAALTLAAGCTALPGGSNPRDVLTAGAELLVPGGSAHVKETLPLSLTAGQPSSVVEGTVSWQGAGGSTGELTVPSILGGPPSRGIYTSDAVYVEVGALGPLASQGLPGLAGKTWIRETYAGLKQKAGPLGAVVEAAVNDTNPVRSAALLVQSPNLAEVGTEQVNGVSATHYSGQIRFSDAVADIKLGLSQEVLDELRREITATGQTDAQQYDLWVDDQGRPLRAQGRSVDPAHPETYSIEYSDYGAPKPVQAPPENEVVDLDQITSGLGAFPR